MGGPGRSRSQEPGAMGPGARCTVQYSTKGESSVRNDVTDENVFGVRASMSNHDRNEQKEPHVSSESLPARRLSVFCPHDRPLYG